MKAYSVMFDGEPTTAPLLATYVILVGEGVLFTKNGPDPYAAFVPDPTFTCNGDPGTKP